MKMLYVACKYSPLDHDAGSGADYDLYHSFLSQGVELSLVGPFEDHPSLTERLYRRVHRLLSRRAHAKYSRAFLRNSAEGVHAAMEEVKPDVVFSYFSAPLTLVRSSVPIVYMLDTPLKGSQRQRPVFSKIEYLRMLNWERRVLEKSARVITWSQWSAEILRDSYGIPESKIAYLPIPASLPKSAIPREVIIDRVDFKPLRLLLVGREYERKGVDIGVRLVDLLNARGIQTELRIVGLRGEDTAACKFFGPYRKTVESELQDYISHYRWAHFLIHPARFEAAGIVPSEAAAFGVPTITTAVGGLETTVRNGESGVVLPRGSPPGRYADVLTNYMDHPEDYLRLRASTRRRFDRELNWEVAGKKILAVVRAAAARGVGWRRGSQPRW